MKADVKQLVGLVNPTSISPFLNAHNGCMYLQTNRREVRHHEPLFFSIGYCNEFTVSYTAIFSASAGGVSTIASTTLL
jgi:hypothetical protein